MVVLAMEMISRDSSLSLAQPTFLVNDLWTLIPHFLLDSMTHPLPLGRVMPFTASLSFPQPQILISDVFI